MEIDPNDLLVVLKAWLRKPKQKPDYEPTPEQIAAACAEVQATWSDEERRCRCGQKTRYELSLAPESRIRVMRNPFSGNHPDFDFTIGGDY